MTDSEYVLITPAKNEQAMIGRTIQAVASQTHRPKRWVIVDDGSTDRTRDIIDDAAHQYAFISPIYATAKKQRNFGSKVSAFAVGYEALKSERYDFVGNLDADVSFDSGYYDQVITRLRANESLGIAGGLVYELVGRDWRPQKNSSNSVAGAIQCFRRECYEAIGGYIPIPTGGIDAAAEIMARAQGWRVRTFAELPVFHHRRVATGRSTVLSTRFAEGTTNYLLGYHPLFQIGSSLYRCTNRPFMLGSLATLLGYGWSCMRGHEVALPHDTVRYLRSEQMARMLLCSRGVTHE
jgi:glycosyltransferase involved in cell wall biosynthesis